jgi:LytR cell envelope-related transcriptional attenuator
MLVVLAAASAVIWVNVLHRAANSTAQSRCPVAATAPVGLPKLTPLPYTALNSVAPTPPSQVRVRTLNASTQTGLANRIDTEVQKLGFLPAGAPGNDPRYPLGDMDCFGQIRFGPNGESAARTVSFILPCAQLVQDNRQDASVDLALGDYFTDLAPNADGQQVLAQLSTWAQHHPVAAGGLQAQSGQLPAVSATLLAGAHVFEC